jgi:branched-chain amino acid transport system substrate-binding protein
MYNDGAMISQQREKMGWNIPVLGASALYSPQLVQLGGSSVNGIYSNVSFFAKDRRCRREEAEMPCGTWWSTTGRSTP